MHKIDLHTHSVGSHDGGIKLDQYRKILQSGALDYIAVTDHNSIKNAVNIHKKLGDQIVVGEEIMTTAGEIIGLYLTSRIEPGLSAIETVKQIKDQHGLVYIPHPFETRRRGLHPATLEELIDYIDIIEVCNGRAFLQNRSSQTVVWARLNHILGSASSDAHGSKGLGRTYTQVSEVPTRDTLLHLIKSGTLIATRPSLQSLLYPKYHFLRRKIKAQR
ncbi:MAG: PHP domain-containing protein [Candidatus Saccharimonadales bacterium]